MGEYVLDAWAVMAWLKGQPPAAARVRVLLHATGARHKLLMSIVNLGEVFYLSVKARDFTYGERVLEHLRSRTTIVSASDDIVMLAASLKARHTISYADGFAAATAMLNNAPLVTGDPELQAMSAQLKMLRIEWIGS
jgi:uncharacterized protein